MAERMVLRTDKDSKSSLHRSLKELSGGLSIKTDVMSPDIKEALTSSINANVDLIKSIPQDYLDNIRGTVTRSIQQGGDMQTLQKKISESLNREQKKVRNKAKNVALDQTRKAATALTSARMEKVGINKFEWVHSGGGQTPRCYHQDKWPKGLNGGIFDINDPPVIDKKTGERGLPGFLPHCKCFMRPIVQFDEGEEV